MRLTTSLIFLFITGSLINGCKEETKVRASLRWQLEYTGEPVVMLQDYTYPDGRTIQFTRVSFYISELTFHYQNQSRELLEVDFVNLTSSHSTASEAADGMLYLSEDVDLEGIDAISFNIGLTPDQNATVPADYASGHPLARPGEYWVAWDSYIFAKIEGWYDAENDGTTDTGIALHLGSNDVMRHLQLPVSDPDHNIDIVIDLHSLFNGASIYDIDANPQIHSLSQLPASIELADNLISSISIKS